MCLVVIAFRADERLPLIIAANRDEFHARPAAPADWWADHREILGGRDLQAGGTWLGVHRAGRFGVITNYSGATESRSKGRSRGNLVADFLQGNDAPADYLRSIAADDYAGFNLLVGDRQRLAYLSNRGGGLRELPTGIYGLSNATLDTPWEKVERSKQRLRMLLDEGRANETHLLRLLGDRDKGPVSEVRSEQLPFALAHALTAPFIITESYGTRCSTVVRVDSDGRWRFQERRFDAAGDSLGDRQYSFRVGVDAQ